VLEVVDERRAVLAISSPRAMIAILIPPTVA